MSKIKKAVLIALTTAGLAGGVAATTVPAVTGVAAVQYSLDTHFYV